VLFARKISDNHHIVIAHALNKKTPELTQADDVFYRLPK
jgi:hypothetical protein